MSTLVVDKVVEQLKVLPLGQADEVFVPSIAIGELCFGAYKSARVADNLARIDAFASGLLRSPFSTA